MQVIIIIVYRVESIYLHIQKSSHNSLGGSVSFFIFLLRPLFARTGVASSTASIITDPWFSASLQVMSLLYGPAHSQNETKSNLVEKQKSYYQCAVRYITIPLSWHFDHGFRELTENCSGYTGPIYLLVETTNSLGNTLIQ